MKIHRTCTHWRYAATPLVAFAALTVPNVLRAATAGTVDSAFEANVAGSYISVVTVQPNGQILIGGSFTGVSGHSRNQIARLNPDGGLESVATFNPGTGANSVVIGIALQADGKIPVTGYFTGIDGQTRNRIARLNPNGSVENVATFDPGTGANGFVRGAAVQPDGRLILWGVFSSVDGQSRNYLARLRPNGTLENTATFNPGTGPNAQVNCVAIQTDGKILIGGEFTMVNGQPRKGIARLLPNGALESNSSFNPSAGPDGEVYCVAVQADGKVLIGGEFSGFSGAPRSRLARLNPDGTLENTTTFNIGTGADARVLSIALQADGKILLGGTFTNFGGVSCGRIARLNAAGTVENEATFNAGSAADGEVMGVTLQPDGGMLVHGGFISFNGQSHSRIVRLLNDPATQRLVVPNPGRIEWIRGGSAPEVSHVHFDVSTNNGASWSALGWGTRVAGGWALSGLSLPEICMLRARGRTVGGQFGSASGLVEQQTKLSGRILISTSFLPVSEGSTNSISVRLSAPPSADVTVGFNFVSGDNDLSVNSGASLVFTSANWNVSQPVTIAAAQDDDGLNGRATFEATAEGYINPILTTVESDDDVGIPVELAGSVSGTYDFRGRDVLVHNVTADPFDGRMAPSHHQLESPGVSGDGNSSGILRVSARSITVDGTIDTSAKGFGGGGGGGGAATGYYGAGGGGGGGVGATIETIGGNGWRGGGSQGVAGNGGGGGAGAGFGGTNGTQGGSGGAGHTPTVNFAGGAGGKGGGPFGGAGGGAGGNGSPGGYGGLLTNADLSLTFDLLRGSGGGGGGGGNAGTSLQNFYAALGGNGGAAGGAGSAGNPGYAGGGGGGGGAAGGGMIVLDATNRIQISATGKLLADGGGNASLNGGYGAGGGIGLRAASIIIQPGAVVRTLGGFGNGVGTSINGGTIKISYGALTGAPDPNLSGRVANLPLTPLERWKLAFLEDLEAQDLGDSDEDGIVDLLEYGLVIPAGTKGTGLPEVQLVHYPDGWHLRTLFTRDPDRNDVTIEVQAASDVAGPWETIAASVLGAPTTGPGYVSGDDSTPGPKTVEVRDPVSASAAVRRFLRLRVVH